MTAFAVAAWCFGARVQGRINTNGKPRLVVTSSSRDHSSEAGNPYVTHLVTPNTIQYSKASRSGCYTLPVAAISNGTMGLMAKVEDSDALTFFDMVEERIFYDPGSHMTFHQMGGYTPEGRDTFWALVIQV